MNCIPKIMNPFSHTFESNKNIINLNFKFLYIIQSKNCSKKVWKTHSSICNSIHWRALNSKIKNQNIYKLLDECFNSKKTKSNLLISGNKANFYSNLENHLIKTKIIPSKCILFQFNYNCPIIFTSIYICIDQ